MVQFFEEHYNACIAFYYEQQQQKDALLSTTNNTNNININNNEDHDDIIIIPNTVSLFDDEDGHGGGPDDCNDGRQNDNGNENDDDNINIRKQTPFHILFVPPRLTVDLRPHPNHHQMLLVEYPPVLGRQLKTGDQLCSQEEQQRALQKQIRRHRLLLNSYTHLTTTSPSALDRDSFEMYDHLPVYGMTMPPEYTRETSHLAAIRKSLLDNQQYASLGVSLVSTLTRPPEKKCQKC